MIGSTADITDRKQAEEELRKLNEELELRVEQRTTELVLAKVAAEEAGQVKSNFLLAMSHELRTPVNQIIGYSELLAEDAADAGQENLVPDLEKIRIAGQGLLAMIINVLDLSDLETGAMKLAIEEFDLTALIADVETTATPLMGANRNTFTVVTGSEI
jgi:signal transduction histidine kinase